MRVGKAEIAKINCLLKDQSLATSRLHIFQEEQTEKILTKPQKNITNHSSFFDKIGVEAKFAIRKSGHQESRSEIKSGYIRRSIIVDSAIKNRHNRPPQLGSISQIDANFAKQHLSSKLSLITATTSPESIYRVLHPLYDKYNIALPLPLIKQYSNCVYFGDAIKREDQYEGFLIFYNEGKIYYGRMKDQKKNGQGVEIDLKRDIWYSGCFDNGKKKGKFRVVKEGEEYLGELKKGQYQGYGVLTTSTSTYKGHFHQGERDGQGEEYFPISKLTISGTFIKNKFTNHYDQISKSRLNHMISSFKMGKTDLPNGLNPEISEQIIFTSGKNKINKQDIHKSYRQYNYDLFEEKYNEINKQHSFRIKEPRPIEKLSPSIPVRKKSISEEEPLQRSKLWQM